VRWLLVNKLMDLAADSNVDPTVRATATNSLRSLLEKADAATRDDIKHFLDRPDAPRKRTTALQVPPGPPI